MSGTARLLLLGAISLLLGSCAAGPRATTGPVVSPTGIVYEPGVPPDDTRYSQTATLYLRQGRHERALDLALEGIDADPGNPVHYFLAGSALARMEEYRRADSMFVEAERIYPAYELQVEPERESAWAVAFNAGVEAYNQGELEGAEVEWRNAAVIFSIRPEAHRNLATLLAGEGEYGEAIRVYRDALAGLESLPATRVLDDAEAPPTSRYRSRKRGRPTQPSPQAPRNQPTPGWEVRPGQEQPPPEPPSNQPPRSGPAEQSVRQRVQEQPGRSGGWDQPEGRPPVGSQGAQPTQRPLAGAGRLGSISVEEVLETQVVTAERETPIAEVVAEMAEKNVGSVVIVEGDSPIGVVTDRRIALALERTPDVVERRADELVDGDFVSGSTEMSALDVLHRLSEAGIRRLPIVDEDGALAGIVTVDDILLLFSEELQNVADIIRTQSPRL